MPSGQEEALLQHGSYQNPENSPSILQAVKEQYKVRRDPEDGSATYTENPYVWRPTQINSVIPEDSEFDPKMSESHMHYYPDHGSALPDYLQEGIPELHETYNLSYQTSTSTNGHHDGDASSNNSESSGIPVDNASLISRNTSQTKTQQVKTVTKIIKTREVHAHHIGPDGKPIISYSSPYGVEGSDYMPFHYANPNDYGTYDPGRPPSPAGETPTYSHDYGTYGRTASPSTGRNFDLYSDYGGYRDFPTTPSGAPTDSPNLHRAMPQAPRSVTSDFNHTHLDLEASALGGVPSRLDYRRTPSPTQASDRYGTPYGYAGQPLPATPSPGYKYDPGLPEGYLDRRPSFDEHPSSRSPQGPHGTSTYPRRPYEEESHTLGGSDGSNLSPIPRPHPHLDYAPESEGDVIRFRDPDHSEIIQFLQHPNNVVRANAAAYLTHICYMDDNMKQKTRSLGGIPPLIDLLNNDLPELQRNACGALKNLSFGRQNDQNKRAICDADGIPALVRLLRKSPDNEIRELATSVLWNLSSCEDLKRPILDEALTTLVNHVIIPHSGYDHARNALEELKRESNDIYWSTVFRNASGVIRNISSAGEYTRKKLRNCEGLIEALVYLVRVAVGKNDIDNKSVENAVCILRNLSYRIQEVEDPNYDKHYPPVSSRGGTTPMKGLLSSSYLAVGETLGCFGANTKKKKENAVAVEKEKQRVPLTKNPISENEPIGGMALLWEPEVVECYLSLLSECSNPDTLEAAAGAIMNLAACLWAPSVDIRASVRKSKGLPILVELLKMEVDRVVCAVATALRNLAVDQRNSALIGNYAMKDLIQKLPNGSASHDAGISDDTIAAVLATLNEVVAKQSDFARSLLQIGGVERLHKITQQKKGTYSPRVVKFATQLLYNMWQHQELRESYRKAGWKECHFVPKSRNSLSSPTGANSTLNRPMSSQSGTKYEDRTLPNTELNSTAASIPYSRSEELPLSELSHNSEPPPPPSSQTHRPHIFPSGMQQAPSPSEPVYAQVKKERKSKKSPIQLLSNEQPDGMPAGDSWV